MCSYPEVQDWIGLPACIDQAQTIMRDGMKGRHNGRNWICPKFLISFTPCCRGIAIPGNTIEGAATWLAKRIFYMKNWVSALIKFEITEPSVRKFKK